MVSRTSMVLQKNATMTNFARSRAQIRVSIGFSCTVLEIQNIGHSRRISPWEVI
ncbi:hypothetical protein GW17_00060093 [Ensete ventricosum]|nr:hypothetical protein GW17_00060093 [Ensete ventricosum]RZS19549.1 hypothetical protein BHM03_00051958 [Ensete ventricosum]